MEEKIWHESNEVFFKQLGDESQLQAICHMNSHEYYSTRSRHYQLPIIILSVICGSGNFVSGDLNPAGTGYSNRVTGGDVAYEPSTGTIAQVIEVTGEDTLTLSAPGVGGGAAFDIYRGNCGAVNNKQGQEGFSLFVGTSGDLSVIPSGSQEPVDLKNVANNSYVPLQVIRVFDSGTTASDILALQ